MAPSAKRVCHKFPLAAAVPNFAAARRFITKRLTVPFSAKVWGAAQSVTPTSYCGRESSSSPESYVALYFAPNFTGVITPWQL